MKLELWTGLVCLIVSTQCAPQGPVLDSNVTKEDNIPIVPKIYEMRIETNVTNRFAKTLITSKVKNLDKKARQATFSVVTPDQAYISGFTMEIDGKSYEAYIQEKEQAKKTYNTAVESGQAAGHVAVSARDSNRFTVSVNLEPQSKAVFYLKYEELLKREDDKYEIVLNIHPGQPVQKLDVEVRIDETRPLKFVKVPSLRSGNEITKTDEKLNPNADIKNVNKTSAVVKFNPDLEKQKQYANGLGTNQDDGLAGQFVVQYDVERDPQGGEVLVDGGYFVHFFAPSDLPALPKQVVFVLDTSGSMEGIRIRQLKEAMHSILNELKKEDVFNIVEFNSIAKVWNIDRTAVQYESAVDQYRYYNQQEDPEAEFKDKTKQPLPPTYPANEENIKKGNEVVDKLVALGGTDIQSALKVALQLVQNNLKDEKKHQPIIVFLTDGEPTIGETNTEKITSAVSELNSVKAPIFSLSFGDGADRDFLQKISLKNLGFARHIYEGADASIQLEQFYKQISSPLLSNVTFKYVSNVTGVTKTRFPILFLGSEIVVAGRIDAGFHPPAVQGWGVHGPIDLTPEVHDSLGNLERLWAYLTLKQILEQRDAADNKTGPTQEALRVALKYSFVSDVSSLVVVKPNSTSAVETEDASSDKGYPIVAGGVYGAPLSLSTPGRWPGQANIAASGYFGGPPVSSLSSLTSDLYASPTLSAHPPGFQSLAARPMYMRPYVARPLNEPSPHLPESVPIPSTGSPILSLLDPTTVRPVSPVSNVTDQRHNDDLEYLKAKLPWLSSILNESGSITFSKGTYDLGINATISSTPECPISPTNNPGECVLIKQCPQIFTQIPDVESYTKYFCELGKYAGICCPKA